MADTAKTLGQLFPTAGALTALYTVPGATSTVVSSLAVCNQGAAPDKFRLSVAVAGAADTAKQYYYYDYVIPAGKTFVATIGITLAATDVVRAYSANGTSSFNLCGAEIT